MAVSLEDKTALVGFSTLMVPLLSSDGAPGRNQRYGAASMR
jgi:hypothetical protein